MIRESFLGRNPSHFQLNKYVKAYIISEATMWSAWNLITPIFAVFIVQSVKGGSIESAAFGYSIFLLSRVFFELVCGRVLQNSNDKKKVIIAISGMIFIGASYIGFSLADTVYAVYIFYCLFGMGIGLAAPAKNALFSIYIDKNKEATEWSISDAVQFGCMAISTIIGGFIAANFGFVFLFYVAFFINILAIVPYSLVITGKTGNK